MSLQQIYKAKERQLAINLLFELTYFLTVEVQRLAIEFSI